MLAWRDLDDPEAGGSERHAHEVLRRWADAGIDVTLRTSFAPNRPAIERRAGYRVIRRAGRYLVFPRAVASELAGRMGPRDAVVEIWNGMPFFTPVWSGVPHVVWLHHVHAEMWQQSLPRHLARVGSTIELKLAPPLYRRASIVTLSDSAKAEIVRRLRVPHTRVHVVPPGIDPAFSPGGARWPRPLVLGVGRLVPVKRFDALIDQLVRVKELVPELEARIVGEGYERPRLEQQIESLGASPWLQLVGRVREHELIDLYRQAWVLTGASSHEGWGMTVTEAAACGTPAVVSNCTGHRDAVVEGRTGLLATDDRDLGDLLVQILLDQGLRERLAAGALERA
ncbi:MAG TPA: glycosyltransferase family 4 protein, partial [Acidimicrobiales bacterium]